MDEKTRAGVATWLTSRGITVTPRTTDGDVVEALWQEVRDALYIHQNGNPKFSDDGTLLDENGNRSILDDVDA